MLGKKSSHPAADELRDYFKARLPDERDREIEAHLAICPQCARHLQQHRLLCVALGDIAAGPRRPVDHRAALCEALAAAAKRAARAALKRRLTTWVAQTSAFAGGVVHWRPGEAGAHSAGQAELLTTFTGSSPWRLVAGPGICKPAAAREETGPTAFVQAAGPHELAVHVSHWVSGALSPLVLLAREVGLDPAVVKQTRPDPKWHTRSARFDDLKPGRYLLGLEPLLAPSDPP
jgi:anti-sigma factor RsiW